MGYQQTGLQMLPVLVWPALLLLSGLLGLWWCRAAMRRRAARHRARERAQQVAHDALVQGVQGLLLQLQSIAEGFPSQDPARLALERLLDRADALLLADCEALAGRDRRV